jgi:hypothetical protein
MLFYPLLLDRTSEDLEQVVQQSQALAKESLFLATQMIHLIFQRIPQLKFCKTSLHKI